jgi:inner membrane protein
MVVSRMEPITHFFTGACMGRAGLNRKTAYATLAATLAAEAADLDVFWTLRGPVEGLKHHRGITHTFIAVPVVAGVIVGAVWLLHRWNEKRRQGKLGKMKLIPGEPLPPRLEPRVVHWGWLYLTCFIAALSHILLDWTNNYGVRPFFPFNPRWYAGSFMFIAEPVVWGLFFLALVMPWLLGLTDREIGARRVKFRGRGWAIFALGGMAALWAWRWTEYSQAGALLNNTQVASAPVTRIAIEPYPMNPFRWHAILETSRFFQTAEVNTSSGTIDSDAQNDVLFKPDDTPAIEAAKRTLLGQVYLDWGQWAVIRDVGQEPIVGVEPPQLSANRAWTTVEFSDLRFAYAFARSGRSRPPAGLTGWVYIIDNRQDGGEAMGGREQK